MYQRWLLCSWWWTEKATPEASTTPTTPPVVLKLQLTTSTIGRKIKLLPPKQILQRLSILFAKVKAANTSGILVNGIWQFAFFLVLGKKNFWKGIQCLTQISIGISMIFMNSENGNIFVCVIQCLKHFDLKHFWPFTKE